MSFGTYSIAEVERLTADNERLTADNERLQAENAKLLGGMDALGEVW